MLDRLLCSRLPKVGRIGLCYALDAKGGVVSEFTVTRLAEERFYLVCASTAEWHDEDLLRAALPADGSARLEPSPAASARWSWPARPSRDVLQQVTPADLSNAAFPWLSAREIELGFGRALALRVNYVGELGWELHLPMEQLLPAYEAVMAAGATRGIRDVGIYAVELHAPRQGLPELEAGPGDRLLPPSRPASTASSTSPSPTSSARRRCWPSASAACASASCP